MYKRRAMQGTEKYTGSTFKQTKQRKKPEKPPNKVETMHMLPYIRLDVPIKETRAQRIDQRLTWYLKISHLHLEKQLLVMV